MKKIKTLTSLLSAGALIAAATPIITLTSCGNKTPEITEKDLIVTLKDVSSEVNLNSKVTKNNFVVKVMMSDLSTVKEVTDWTCDQFDSEGKYVFGTRGPIDLTIKYKTLSFTQSFTVVDPNSLTTIARVITMPRSVTSGEVLDSKTQLKVYANGTRYDTGLHFSVKEGRSIDIVDPENGIIQTKDFGETIIKVVCNESNLEGEITVNVANSYVNYWDISWTEETNEASIAPSMPATSAENRLNDYVVPETLLRGSVEYKVTGLKTGTASTNVNNITHLHISKDVKSINSDIFADPESKLQHIYYDNTKSQWETLFGKEGNEGGLQTVGVLATDGFLTFDNCVDSSYWEISGEKVLRTDDPVGGELVRETYTARFNYSKIKNDSTSSYRKIVPYNSAWQKIANISVIAIWVDGLILKNDETPGRPKWSQNEETGEIEFDFSASGTPLFDPNTNIVIEFRTNYLTYGSVYLAAEQV